MSKKYTIDTYFGREEEVVPNLQMLTRDLNGLLREIKHISHCDEVGEANDLLSSIQYYEWTVDAALNIVSELEQLYDSVSYWRNECECRLTAEERKEFEENKTFHRLKHNE